MPTTDPGSLIPFARVASGLSGYHGALQLPLSTIASTRLETRTFRWLLAPRDQAKLEAVNYRRWAVVGVVEQVEPGGWKVEIEGIRRLGRLVHAGVALLAPPPFSTCTCDPGVYYFYDLVKVRKAALQRPLPASVVLEWQTPPPASASIDSARYLLPRGSWCWSWSGGVSCTSPYDSVSGIPTIEVHGGASVAFDFQFTPDSVTLTMLDASARPIQTFSIIFPSSLPRPHALWEVPADFSTPPEGRLALVHAAGPQGEVDYLARFVSGP